MKFLLDENVDFPLAGFLKDLGHDVTAVAHGYPHALKDTEILAIANQEERVIVTNDQDFGELVFRRGLPHQGVVLFRLRQEGLEIKKAWLERVITHHADHLDRFIVITDAGIRVRRTRPNNP